MTNINKIPKTHYSSDDAKPPTKHKHTFNDIVYIFGDIEGNKCIFNSTISIIRSALQNKKSKFIFLGDIYDYRRPNETIEQIKFILSLFNIPLNNIFNEESSELSIIRTFRALWKLKELKFYKKKCIQYLYSLPHPDKLKQNYNQLSMPIFLFGNKEVIFIQEIIECQHITKSNLSFTVPANYIRKYTTTDTNGELHEAGSVKHTIYNFTIEELNIMYTYLSLCQNYFISGNKLYIHCYFNYKLFLKANYKFDYIISGHSKGYGKFKDSQFPLSTIIINDLTGLEQENLVNCVTLNGTKFNTSYNPTFKPPLTQLI